MEGVHLDTINAILMGVLVIILVITLYVEFKFMRPKRKDDMVMVLDRDDAYNSLTNTSAVALSLRNVGKDTTKAEVLLEKAKMEYDRKDYAKVMATTKLARDSLMVAPEKDLPIDLDEVDGPTDTFIDVAEDDSNVHDVKKLPQNYLESRFLISSVQSEIDSARGTKDVSAAEAQLNEAKVDFEAANYNAALTHSMKARKTLEGLVVTTAVATPEMEVAKVAAVVKAPEIDQCDKCGAELTKDDQFCGSCGEKSGKPTTCPHCNGPLKPTDTFCRKCGKKVT